jgi:putative transposase
MRNLIAMIPQHLGPPVAEQTYFITSNTDRRLSVFQTERWARVFLKTLYRYKREGKYLLHAFVLMPDHFHLLITPIAPTTLGKALQMIKGGSAHQLTLAGRGKGAVWQKGYTDHRLRNAVEYQEMLIYIQKNPVKAGLVAIASEYRYGSAYPGYKLDPPKPYLGG